MSQVVRRVPSAASGIARELLAAKSFRCDGMSVASQLCMDIDPIVQFSWQVPPRYWADGFRLLIFRNSTGFCPELYPKDLNRHGQLIVEACHDAEYEEHPAEGTLFFTFVLQRKVIMGLARRSSALRFSVTIPSAKIAISRLKDQIELQEMLQRHEVRQIEHKAALNEAELRRLQSKDQLGSRRSPSAEPQPIVDTFVAHELAGIDALVEAFLACKSKRESLKDDPRFQKLGRKEQKAVLQKLADRLDGAEISARREMYGRRDEQ